MGDQKIISRNGKNDSLANPRWIRKDNRASASASERVRTKTQLLAPGDLGGPGAP